MQDFFLKLNDTTELFFECNIVLGNFKSLNIPESPNSKVGGS